jgi:hypothetical protein
MCQRTHQTDMQSRDNKQMIGTGFGKYLSLSGAYRSRIANSQGNEKSSQRFIVDCRRSQLFNSVLNTIVHSVVKLDGAPR